jgi:hypothetical protein
MNPNFNPRKNKKLSYVLNLIISIILIGILPSFILTNQPLLAFAICFILDGIVCNLVGAYWRPWKLIK